MASDSEVIRTLAAILMADVANYGQLMGGDEPATIRTLQAYRKIFIRQIESRRGRVLDVKGDAIMAAFNSTVDAVAASVAIQREISEQNELLPENRRMRFRIGINLGDVVEEDDTLYGDGVNIAGRLESIAEPGGVCISRGVHDQIVAKLPLEFEYLGENQVKKETVRAYRVIVPEGAEMPAEYTHSVAPAKHGPLSSRKVGLAGAAVAVIIVFAGLIALYLVPGKLSTETAQESALSLPDKPSIAVLPFINMSGDPEQEYFSDGLTETLISALARLPDVFVIARNSVFVYKGSAVDVRQVGQDLGVGYVLEGSVQRQGDWLRVMAQLIEAETGRHLWAQTYDRAHGELFAVQDEITLNILAAMNVELVSGETHRRERPPTRNLKAYDLFLRGTAAYRRQTKADNAQALVFLEQALELDPEFSLAMAMLATAHSRQAWNGWTEHLDETWETVERWAGRSLALDNTESLVFQVLAGKRWYKDYDLAGALAYAERAVELAPGSPIGLRLLGAIQTFANEEQKAYRNLHQAIRLSPVPQPLPLMNLAYLHWLQGRPEIAVDHASRCLTLAPELPSCHRVIVLSLVDAGQLEEARHWASALANLLPGYNMAQYRDIVERITPDPGVRERMVKSMRRAGLPEGE